MSNGTTTTPVVLDLQTGMPPTYPSRSKELSYDSLMYSPRFMPNQSINSKVMFGPQQLNLTRNHW